MTAKVVVIGSVNVDLVAPCARLPRPGETLRGGVLEIVAGGKGANQALAAARLGASVALVACVGQDSWADVALAGLREQGVDLSHVSALPGVATGTAMIQVDAEGQNSILLSPGANDALTPARIDAAEDLIRSARLLVCQLETPMASVERAVAIAYAAGVPVLLNPAPAQHLPDSLLRMVDYLVPNESEAAAITATEIDDLEHAVAVAVSLSRESGGTVLVTLGKRGVMSANAQGCRHFPAPMVNAVDTTGAGDTFIGGLVAALVNGSQIDDAIAWGQRAAAISVQRHGAQAAMPSVLEMMN